MLSNESFLQTGGGIFSLLLESSSSDLRLPTRGTLPTLLDTSARAEDVFNGVSLQEESRSTVCFSLLESTVFASLLSSDSHFLSAQASLTLPVLDDLDTLISLI